MTRLYHWLFWTSALSTTVSSTRIIDIQGPAFLSPLQGQSVKNVTGVVTAKVPLIFSLCHVPVAQRSAQASTGFYLVGEKSDDIRVSNGIYVYSTYASVLGKVQVGDAISLDGTVAEFRSASNPSYLFITEITYPGNVTVLSSNNTITPVVLGKDRSPPTQALSALDKGADGWLSVPNNQSLISTTNATLQPDKYGLDFWESLEGQLVTIPSPAGLGFQNNYGEFWVHGDWPVTGKNKRGGLSITFGKFISSVSLF